MCVDYTSLNKSCPKVPFPLPRIDQIVDSTAGCKLLSFLDAYSGYHQIKMKESDQLATSFITPFDMYFYVTMPYGLRNAGATYQRCMLHVFGDHLGRSVEAYVDDIVVKSRKADDLVADLRIAFDCLRAKGVKLNPEKCVFRVPRGMLLGFIVSQRGNEPNPDKVSAITRMGPIRDLKGVQRVMGCLASLSRFISRLARERLTPVSTLEENRALHVDPQSSRGPRKAEGIAHPCSHSYTTYGRRAPLSIRGRNDPSGQRGDRCGKTRGGSSPARPEAGVLYQRGIV